MTKALQALLTGMFVTFILDFFIFLGLLKNYIDFYEIKVYYNVLFVDHQNIFLFMFFSIIIGFSLIYVKNLKISALFISLLFIISLSTLYPSVGYALGEKMFMQKNVTLNDKKNFFVGDIYYEGREIITFYDYDLKKTILLKKKDLIR
ncbi:MAG: hypothetical protein M0Q24_05380 [Sulfurimonas sp.]|uniref:hypothetical protein n=1 Tax=Sulfurimonas sp. TaxID=2022749 RepID=UPI0025E7FCEA|nr:hypothetical protein [Sulfurimonas sp.]MCK9491502.1 hypothetical protein [Sulfurimonas sp.]